jgi:hypothetical protein
MFALSSLVEFWLSHASEHRWRLGHLLGNYGGHAGKRPPCGRPAAALRQQVTDEGAQIGGIDHFELVMHERVAAAGVAGVVLRPGCGSLTSNRPLYTA